MANANSRLTRKSRYRPAVVMLGLPVRRRKVHINNLEPYRPQPPEPEAALVKENVEEEQRAQRMGSREDDVLDEAEPMDLRPHIVNPLRRI